MSEFIEGKVRTSEIIHLLDAVDNKFNFEGFKVISKESRKAVISFLVDGDQGADCDLGFDYLETPSTLSKLIGIHAQQCAYDDMVANGINHPEPTLTPEALSFQMEKVAAVHRAKNQTDKMIFELRKANVRGYIGIDRLMGISGLERKQVHDVCWMAWLNGYMMKSTLQDGLYRLEPDCAYKYSYEEGYQIRTRPVKAEKPYLESYSDQHLSPFCNRCGSDDANRDGLCSTCNDEYLDACDKDD